MLLLSRLKPSLAAPERDPVTTPCCRHMCKHCSTTVRMSKCHTVTADERVLVVTFAATHSVAHGVALLDAQEPFLQKSGCNRTRLLASTSEANVRKLVDAGAPAKLVAMLQRTSDDGADA